MGAMPANDEKRGSPEWADAARERGIKRFVDALGKRQHMRQRLGESEDRMARTGEDYRRTILSGAELPPPSIVRVTLVTVPVERIPSCAD